MEVVERSLNFFLRNHGHPDESNCQTTVRQCIRMQDISHFAMYNFHKVIISDLYYKTSTSDI